MIVKWRNTPKVSSHCINKRPITLESNLAFYKGFVETGRYKQFIVERIDEDFGVSSYPIATVYLKDMDMFNKRCELCVFTSDDQEWNTESQSMAIKMLLDKAFNEYGMHKVYSYVFYRYIDEAELLRSAGFVAEGELKNEALSLDWEYEDIVRFGVFMQG
jgi:RimJ/RimL family protein N-acetyltransferase